MFRLHKFANGFLLIFTIICSSLVAALENDNQQPLHVTADSSSFNYKTGTGLYEGNVSMIQGSAHLQADRVEIHNNIHHKVDRAIASGIHHDARYWSQLKPGEPLLHASAKTIWFYPIKSLLVLKGNAKVQHGKNIFQGPVLTWNTKDKIAVAPPSRTGHATIVIRPDEIAP
jgi:lipopolysaccharide export system protein LptA